MKRSVVGLAAAFGATKIVKSVLQMGSGIEDAVIRVRRFTDEVRITRNNSVKLTGEMAESFRDVTKSVPGRVVLSDFLNGFAAFKQFLSTGTLQQFNKLFSAAGQIAKISGRPVLDVFTEMREAAKSGDLTDLSKVIGGIDVKNVAMANFVKQLQAVDPTGVATIEQRINGFFKVLQDNRAELRRFSEQVIGTSGGQVREFKANLKEIGETIGLRLTKPMKGAITATNQFFNDWIEGGATWKSLVDTMTKRSSIFGAALGAVGELTNALAEATTNLFKKLNEGFNALDASVRKRGFGGTAEVIINDLQIRLRNAIEAVKGGVGLSDPGGGNFRPFINPGGSASEQGMRRLNAARARQDVLRGRGISSQVDAGTGQLIILEAPITINAPGGDASKIAEETAKAIERRIQGAKANFRPRESSPINRGQ